MIRFLTPREIECRIAQIKDNGLQLLLYKDARCDMAILDETFGPMNWKREHSRDNANCIVSIWDDEKKEWVSKEDTGTESNTEALKGLASDSFKRACVNWGIGRELYTSPFIWITNANIKNDGGRPKCYDKFEVSDIGYNEHREITRLTIINSKTGAVVYVYGTEQKPAPKPAEPKPEPKPAPAKKKPAKKIGQEGIYTILSYCREFGINSDALCQLYKVDCIENVTEPMLKNMNEHWDDIYQMLGGNQ